MRPLFLVLISATLLVSCNTEEVEITDARISVYPNPFYHHIFIDVGVNESAAVEVNIYGELGQPNDPQIQYSGIIPDKNPIINETLSNGGRSYEIVAASWESGTYIMEVTINGKTERFNLIKLQ